MKTKILLPFIVTLCFVQTGFEQTFGTAIPTQNPNLGVSHKAGLLRSQHINKSQPHSYPFAKLFKVTAVFTFVVAISVLATGGLFVFGASTVIVSNDVGHGAD